MQADFSPDFSFGHQGWRAAGAAYLSFKGQKGRNLKEDMLLHERKANERIDTLEEQLRILEENNNVEKKEK